MSGAAYSIDGRTFEFEAPLSGALPIGSYVRLDTGDQAFLGQLLQEMVRGSSIDAASGDGAPQSIVGHGLLLARLDADGPRRVDGTAVFGQATMDRADSGMVNEHFAANRGTGASLELGANQRMPDVPAMLRASGFGRHTFLCGQSGSGKTYTLGLVLEQLLLEADIRIGVVDPTPTMSTSRRFVRRAIPASTTTGTGPWPSDTLWSQGVSTCSVGRVRRSDSPLATAGCRSPRPKLAARSTSEGLVAGKIAPDPLLFKTGRRFTVEGGSDVPSTWAR